MGIRLAACTAAWLVLAAPNAHAVTLSTWLGGTSPWSNAAQWSSNPLYPCNGNGGESFDVIIAGGTPTLDLACSIEALTLSSGVIGGGFDLTVNQPFAWSGGTLGGSGTVTAAGGASLSGAGIKTFGGSRSLVLGGASQWSDGLINLGGGGATLRNTSAFSITGPTGREMLDFSNSATFLNEGTLTVALDSAASQVTLSPGTFIHSGALHVNTGTLALLSSGILTGSIDSGGGELLFQLGPYTLASGSSLELSSLEVNAPVTVLPGASFEVNDLHIFAGTLTLNIPVTVDSLTLNGTLSGDQLLQVDGLLDWGGLMSGSGTTLAAGGVDISFGARLAGTRTLELATGTTSTTGNTAIDLGSGGATLRNQSGSTLNVIGGGSEVLDEGNTGTVVNEGTIAVDLMTPTRLLTLSPGTLTQNGAVHVNQGILALLTNGSYGGSFDGAGTLRFRSGNHHLLPGSSVTTAHAEIVQGNVTVDAGASFEVGSLLFGSGTLGGAGDVETGTFIWEGGSIAGSGTTTVLAGASLEDAFKVFLGTRNLSLVGGSSSWSEGAIQVVSGSGHLRNEAGSTLTVTGATRNLGGVAGATILHNDGALTFDLDDATQILHVFQGTIENEGTLDLVTGKLEFLTTAFYIQTAGTTRLSGGTLSALNPLDFQGGTLEGTGVVDADIDSAGVIAPGLSPGTIEIQGNLALLPGSELRTELAGLAQATQYDFVNVTGGGTAALDGTLSVAFLSGFEGTVTPANSFIVLEAATPLTGVFTNVGNGQRVLTPPAYDSIAVAYGPGSAFGANRVALHDFRAFVAEDAITVQGTAQGGSITFTVAGVTVVVDTTPGQSADEVAEAIAAAIRGTPALAVLGIAGVAQGNIVDINAVRTGVIVVTDAGLAVNGVATVPALPAIGALALAALLLAAGARRRRSSV